MGVHGQTVLVIKMTDVVVASWLRPSCRRQLPTTSTENSPIADSESETAL